MHLILKEKKKSQIHFSDVVRLPYCLSFLIAGPLQAGGQLEKEGSERKEGTFYLKGMPLGDATHLAGPVRVGKRGANPVLLTVRFLQY